MLSPYALALLVCLAAPAPQPTPEEPLRAQLARLSGPLAGWVKAPWVKRWARGAAELPPLSGGALVCSADRRACRPAADGGVAAGEQTRVLDEAFAYGRIADPLGYARAYDVLAARLPLRSLEGKRVLDLGYGNVGALAMVALAGAQATGVEVDAALPPVAAALRLPRGLKVRALDGFFPADARLRAEVGRGYDLFISKNTLKKGYIHPDRPPPDEPRMRIDLGVSDADYLAAVRDTLVPGGAFFIYNLSPKPSPPDEPFKPWSDGRCPFTREALEAAGFEVLAFDEVDDEAARAMAHVLEWDRGPTPMDVAHDLFAHFTLARRAR